MLDLIAAAEDNYLTAFRSVAGVAPKGSIAEDSDLLHVFTGAGIPLFNQTMVKSSSVDPDVVLDSATSFHADHDSSRWCLSLRQTDAARFEKSATARGFVCTESLPFMVLEGLTESSLPEQLSVRQVTDVELAREHFELVARSFGAPFVLFEPLLGTESERRQ